MQYNIILSRSWRPRAKPQELFHSGTYRVPEDMSQEMAESAVVEAGAEKTSRPARKPAASGGDRQRRPYNRKTPAPENKVIQPSEVKASGSSEQESEIEAGDNPTSLV